MAIVWMCVIVKVLGCECERGDGLSGYGKKRLTQPTTIFAGRVN